VTYGVALLGQQHDADVPAQYPVHVSIPSSSPYIFALLECWSRDGLLDNDALARLLSCGSTLAIS
jgi:hypothetical protein